MNKPQKLSADEVAEHNAQMERYKITGIAHLSDEDMDMDFSKVDNPDC